mmetsp:Transcript_14888/g.47883  ORF Transcript_14888/g.47883 Transcript_14888/m.47883 type:complete len:286 (-) Transcript_14888:135-992(-)
MRRLEPQDRRLGVDVTRRQDERRVVLVEQSAGEAAGDGGARALAGREPGGEPTDWAAADWTARRLVLWQRAERRLQRRDAGGESNHQRRRRRGARQAEEVAPEPVCRSPPPAQVEQRGVREGSARAKGQQRHPSPRLLRDSLRQAGRLQVAPRVLYGLDGGTRGDEGKEVLQPQLRLERRAQLGEPVPCGRTGAGSAALARDGARACRRGGCSGGACRGGGLPAGGQHSAGDVRAPAEPRESVLLWGEARGVAGAGGGAHSPSHTTAGLGLRLGGEARPSPGDTR